MIPLLLAQLASHPPLPARPPQTTTSQTTTAQTTIAQATLAQAPSTASASCPAAVQPAAVAAIANLSPIAGNNFNLAAVTDLLATSAATRSSSSSLQVLLSTIDRTGSASDNTQNNAAPSCRGTTLLNADLSGTLALAGSSLPEAFVDPAAASEADLTALLGQNRFYSLTPYSKRSAFQRRAQGWIALQPTAASQGSSLGTLTLRLSSPSDAKARSLNYPVLHLARLAAGSQGAVTGLSLRSINGEPVAANTNPLALLSGSNLAVNGNRITNSAASPGLGFGSVTIKAEGVQTLVFDLYGNPSAADRLLLSLSSAIEQPVVYGYGSIQAGVAIPGTYSGLQNPFLGNLSLRNTLSLNSGFNGELGLGYRGTNARADLSVGNSNFGNQRETYTLSGPGGSASASNPGNGSVNLFTVMANGYLDLKMRNDDGAISRWSPYIGGGIGVGSLSSPSCSTGNNCNTVVGGTGTGFAYQLKAGLSYRANPTGRLFLEGAYQGLTATRAGNVNYDAFGDWRINLGWRQAF